VIVDKGIILTDFPHYIVNLFICSESQESLFDVKVLFLDFIRHHDVIVILVCNQQELLDESRWRWESNKFQYCLKAVVYLALKAKPIILDNTEMRMTNPGINEFLIKVLGFFDTLVAGFIILVSKEFFSTLSCCHEMYHSLVSSVSELHGTPTSLV
jgi:hypothetical protein